MPTLPALTGPSIAPAGASGVFEGVDAGAEHFGAFTAQAGQRLGATLERAGDLYSQQAIEHQKNVNESATDAALTSWEGNVRPSVGSFKELRGSDAMNARAGTIEQVESMRKDARGALQNPQQRQMFDAISRRAAARYLDDVEFHAAREAKVWMGDTAVGAITNEVNNSATNWGDNQRFAESLGIIKLKTDKLSQLKGIDPDSDAGRANVQHYQSEAWTARIRSVMAADPDVARELYDANADHLDAAHRASLDQQITSHQWTKMMRDQTQQAREDRDADKAMRTVQTANLAKYTADTLQGKAPSAGQLADLIRTQQLPVHAAEFLPALAKKKTPGAEEDNALAVIELHKVLADHSLSVDDKTKVISGAVTRGFLKSSTAGSLVDQAYRSAAKGDSDEARQDLSSVMHAVGVPDGMVNMNRDEQRRKAAVLVEWGDRVTRGAEASKDVRNDLIEKYNPPGQPPVTWPRPKFGAVNSTQDVQAVAQRTDAAIKAGQLTPERGQAEKENLVRYAQFYQKLDQARAAAAAVRKDQPKSGEKAKLKGVVPAPAGGGS